MIPIIGACDPSATAIGWARSRSGSALGEAWTSGVYQPRGRDTPRLQDIVNATVRLFRGCDLVVIEGYSYGSPNRKGAGSRAHLLGEVGGAIKLGIHQLRVPPRNPGRIVELKPGESLEVFETRVPLVILTPATVKKLATGNGGAGKPQMLTEAVRRLGYAGFSVDEADALWILQCALIHYNMEGARSLPAKNRSALSVVEWPTL